MAVDVGLGLKRVAAIACAVVGLLGAVFIFGALSGDLQRGPGIVFGLVTMAAAYGAYLLLAWVIDGFTGSTAKKP